MWVLLLPTFYTLSYLTLQKKSNHWRKNIILASLIFGIAITAITEILSFFSLLTFSSLILVWILLNICMLLLFHKTKRSVTHTGKFTINKHWLVYIILIVALTGVVAWVAAPNNGDSMSYHLPRVMHWIQNKSIAYYPTHVLRQLHLSPWAEFGILHIMLLSGSDRYVNLLQWFAFIGCIIGVSLIAKQLGSSKKGQFLASFVCATIPMAILQASSTQNDLVVSFWLVCGIYFILKKDFFWIGVSLGLAFLTKGTAYIYIIPFIVFLILSQIKRMKTINPAPFFLMLIIFVALNSGYYIRNSQLYGNPLGPGYEGSTELSYMNRVFTPALLVSNTIRNFALQIGTPFDSINTAIERFIQTIHEKMGLSMNDPRITWGGESPTEPKFHVIRMSNHEDTAGNPLDFFLFFIATVFLIRKKIYTKDKLLCFYGLCVISMFLLFSALLRWQLWHSRLHLPIFILSAPFAGTVFAENLQKKIYFNIFVLVLFIFSLPWIILNWSRPLIRLPSTLYNIPVSMVSKDIYKEGMNILNTPRIDQYFVGSSGIKQQYTDAVDYLREQKCDQIGLMYGDEYQLWVLLERYKPHVRIEHVNVENVSSHYYEQQFQRSFHPCAVIVVNEINDQHISVMKRTYKETWVSQPVHIYMEEYIQ